MANRGLRDLARRDWITLILAGPETVRNPLTRGQLDPPARLLDHTSSQGLYPLAPLLLSSKPTSCMCFETLSGAQSAWKTGQ